MANWKEETARDLISFGSIPFFIVILGRAFIKPYWIFVLQLISAFAILFILSIFLKKADKRSAISLIILVFSSLFYNNLFFTLFVIIIWILLLISLVFLNVRIKKIIEGVILGSFASLISYFLISLI